MNLTWIALTSSPLSWWCGVIVPLYTGYIIDSGSCEWDRPRLWPNSCTAVNRRSTVPENIAEWYPSQNSTSVALIVPCYLLPLNTFIPFSPIAHTVSHFYRKKGEQNIFRTLPWKVREIATTPVSAIVECKTETHKCVHWSKTTKMKPLVAEPSAHLSASSKWTSPPESGKKAWANTPPAPSNGSLSLWLPFLKPNTMSAALTENTWTAVRLAKSVHICNQ